MRLFLQSIFLLLLLGVTGCASNYYNVPREVYEKKVRVLGVAPIMLDEDSEFRYPEKAALLQVIREANRKNEKELAEILKGNGEYFSVRFLDEDPDLLYRTILSRRERRDDAGVVYNKYFYKPEEIKKLVEKHNVDAVMLVTVSGITLYEKIFSSNFMAYLEDNYNDLIMTAQILDGNGTLLWEYPNFRQRFISYTPFFALQYPDFEEARANLTDQVRIKNKSIAGIERAFAKTEKSSARSARQVSAIYNRQFLDMTDFLQYFRNPFAERKAETPTATPAAPKDEGAAKVTAPAPAPPAAQPLQTPLAPQAVPAQPAPRELEPVKPLDPGTQVIKEPEIK